MKKYLRQLFEKTDDIFSAGFTPACNPMLFLGTMGWFFYWIVVASGIYLYIFFDTGVTEAYESIEYLTNTQWYAGGVMRSFHRYASDALVIVIFLHMLREYSLDRFHGPRAFTWIIGVMSLLFIYASGITGYWIVWDKLAQYIAISTSEWLDTLPLFGESIARNFLHDTTLSGRFFTLFVFIHIAAPLILLLFMWMHIQRITMPKVMLPRYLATGILLMLLALSLFYPATSQGPAELDKAVTTVGLDWYYMFFYPLLDEFPGLYLWIAIFLLVSILLCMPWITRKKSLSIAKIDLDNCNGCGRCVSDCPYNAVSLQARTDELPYTSQAVVNPDLCVSCGICAGACPTAMPFRRKSKLVPGIELPDFSINQLRQYVIDTAEIMQGRDRVFIFSCDHGPVACNININNTTTVSLPCVGMLPPSFIDFILSQNIADGVFLTGCKVGNCYNRFGINWTKQRITGERDPFLRERVSRERISQYWTGSVNRKKLIQKIIRFKEKLASLNNEVTGFNN
ncbi:MAG TPA: 4Fe-4S binding protein [Gammaproteobacteria bacterium]|nr:4Fe-4S binding protein [Gammaproteobacteria bacterium]